MAESIATGNVTGYSQDVSDIYRPTNVEEVIGFVESARKNGSKLYVVSRGLNWGYGSRSPVTAGCALLDLAGMNRILNKDDISVANPVAVIEAGVTQGQLHEFLEQHCPDLTFNVTGSGRETSILGNALDGGVGYIGSRREDLFGLEVVCGSGKVLRTGFRRLGDSSPLAHSHPYGLGPMLDGLFFQGNFGVVTSACFRLIPRQHTQVALSLALKKEASLSDFVDTLMQLKQGGVVPAVTHIGDKARTHATLMRGIVDYLQRRCGYDSAHAVAEGEKALLLVAPDEWTSLTAISGGKRQVASTVREIRDRMKSLARVRVVSDSRLDSAYAICDALKFVPAARRNAAALSAIRPLHALTTGQPSNVAIDNLLWKFGRPELDATELDRSGCGILYVCPALPPKGSVVQSTIAGMKKIAAEFGHTLYSTVNIESASSIVGVLNLLFDRRSADEVEKAHRCSDALLEYIWSSKLEVYRARADMMERIVSADPAYWGTVRSLKNELDPDNVISPGRYNVAA